MQKNSSLALRFNICQSAYDSFVFIHADAKIDEKRATGRKILIATDQCSAHQQKNTTLHALHNIFNEYVTLI